MPQIKSGLSQSDCVWCGSRCTFYRNGYYYLFWTDINAGLRVIYYSYATSYQGIAAAASTILISGGPIDNYYFTDVEYVPSIDVVGIACALNNVGTAPYFGYGTFNSNGSINMKTMHNPPFNITGGASFFHVKFASGIGNSGSWIGSACSYTGGDIVSVCRSNVATPTTNAHWDNIYSVATNVGIGDSRIAYIGDNEVLLVWPDSSGYMYYNRMAFASGVAHWQGARSTGISISQVMPVYATWFAYWPAVAASELVYDEEMQQAFIALEGYDSNSIGLAHYNKNSDTWTWNLTAEIIAPIVYRNFSIEVWHNNVIFMFTDNSGNYLNLYIYNAYSNSWVNYTGNLSGEFADAYLNNQINLRFTKIINAFNNGIENAEILATWYYNPGANRQIWMNKLDLTATFSIDFTGSPRIGKTPLRAKFNQQNIVTVTIS